MGARFCVWKFSRTTAGFLMAIGFTTIIHGMTINGITSVNVSTIERRFHFESILSGIIASAYDITSCLTCPLITYYGGKLHKPRMISAGMVVFVGGCITSALPHFVSEAYEPLHNLNDSGLCVDNHTRNDVNGDLSFSRIPLVLFLIANILLGVGTAPILTFSLTYIDDNTTEGKSASYIGIIGGCSSIGTVCGYLLGGYSLSFFVHPGGNTAGISQQDPTWIGNWWAPFVLSSIMAVVCIFLLLQFPKTLHRTNGNLSGDNNSVVDQNTSDDAAGERKVYRFSTSVTALLKNRMFLFTIIASGLECFLLNGFSVFLSKFLQNRFMVSPTAASLLAGGVSVPGAACGQVAAGYTVRKFKVKIRGILRLACILTVITGLLNFNMLLYCPGLVHKDSENCRSEMKCECDQKIYRPVCGEDGIDYFSACHAGCKRVSEDRAEVFEACSCIRSNTSMDGSARKGTCQNHCDKLVPFLVLLFFTILLSFSVTNLSVLAVMRCVEPDLKSFAIGVHWFAIRVIGSIPSPLIIGYVFDASCEVWMKGNGEGEFCWTYNNASFSRSIILMAATVKVLSFGCFAVAYRRCGTLGQMRNKVQQEKLQSLSNRDNSSL